MARVAGRTFTRLDVARAAWRVIVRDGLHHASVRAIAQELGATTGVVTYHFRDKDDLMLFALDRLGEGILAGFEEELAGAEGIERLYRLFNVTLPVGPQQAVGWRIWIAFTGYALTHPKLMEEHRKRQDLLRVRIATELSALRDQGVIHRTVDPLREADAIIALNDGIGLSYLLRPELYPPKRQREIVAAYLASLTSRGRPKGVRRKTRNS